MSDQAESDVTPDGPPRDESPPQQPDQPPNLKVYITVGIDLNGCPTLHGAIGDEIIALGLLEKGKQLLNKFHREQEAELLRRAQLMEKHNGRKGLILPGQFKGKN